MKRKTWILGSHFYCDDCDYIPSSMRDAQKHCDETGHNAGKEKTSFIEIKPTEKKHETN